jgi:hypothetical protein
MSFAPPRSGTFSPPKRPTRREKNGMKSPFRPDPNTKISDPSRKNALFSGKNNGNLVRLTCRVSTSVSAKSGLTVR